VALQFDVVDRVGNRRGGRARHRKRPHGAAISRLLYWAARAKREQLEVKKLEGQLVDVAEVETMWARLTANFRTRLLALPTKLAGRLVGIGAANVIRSKLEDEVHSALSELSAEANAIADGEAAPSDGKDSQHGIA
jgi:hypothetical protein